LSSELKNRTTVNKVTTYNSFDFVAETDFTALDTYKQL